MGGRADAGAYVASLNRLSTLQPDLWLPAVPSHGQNANLYDDEWHLVIEDNRRGIAALPAL